MKIFLFTVLLSASVLSAPQRARAEAKRRSVLDYYYLLPYLGNTGYETRREKKRLLDPKSYHKPVVDLRHDYIEVGPDSAPTEQIAVFRFRGGPDLIATSSPDYDSDYNDFKLWRLHGGKLHDVTRHILHFDARTIELAYELPRFGTTIHVFRFSLEPRRKRRAFDLLWRGGHFVMRRG